MAEVLRARADHTPDALAYGFLPDGEEEGPRLSYAGLDREARAVAAALQDAAGPGDRALLLYAPGLAFASAFFGCQYAGVVPVPAYPPRPDRIAQSRELLLALAADCDPRVVLTDAATTPFVPAEFGDRRVVTDALDPAAARRWREPAFDPDALALLQYTSGSTAAPRGVMVSHRNLMHNQELIHTAFEHCGPGVGVNWLPPYHDMGLIGGLLQVAYHGAACRMMSPVVMLMDPGRWLRAVSRYRADTSGGPDFAYDYCAQRVAPEEKAGLDLSHWSVAAVGAEPVSPATLERFAAAFAPCGFKPETFFPCYGLAEATLFVTGGPKAAGPTVRRFDGSRPVVGCGRTWPGQEVRIVDPDARAVRPDGEVGEIWLRGPSVAKGYWNRPAETAETFAARLASGDGPYLRTGDLGVLHGGELFVTGRAKDLIVIRGRNHYPQDVEATVQAAHAGLRPGGGAAFEVMRDGRPCLVVVQEVDRRCRDLDAARVTGDVRQAVAERHELQLHELVLLAPGTIARTSSGKVRRHRCRAEYEAGGLRRWTGRKG